MDYVIHKNTMQTGATKMFAMYVRLATIATKAVGVVVLTLFMMVYFFGWYQTIVDWMAVSNSRTTGVVNAVLILWGAVFVLLLAGRVYDLLSKSASSWMERLEKRRPVTYARILRLMVVLAVSVAVVVIVFVAIITSQPVHNILPPPTVSGAIHSPDRVLLQFHPVADRQDGQVMTQRDSVRGPAQVKQVGKNQYLVTMLPVNKISGGR